MPGGVPSLSTDQVAAFVEVARQGSLRRAADVIVITEQGLRNRLLALEQRLGVELYVKRRGLRRATQLTEAGRQFLPHAVAFLDRGRELGELFAGDGAAEQPREVHVVASSGAKDPVEPFIDPAGYRAFLDSAETEFRDGVVH